MTPRPGGSAGPRRWRTRSRIEGLEVQIAQLRLTAQLSDRGSLVKPGDYGLTVAAKICELGPLTALPQLSWIFWGASPCAGSREMPMVSPGQTLRRPDRRDTRMGPASHPVWMENGRRYWENRRADRVK